MIIISFQTHKPSRGSKLATGGANTKDLDSFAKSKSIDTPIEFIRELQKTAYPLFFEKYAHPNLLIFICRNAERIQAQV